MTDTTDQRAAGVGPAPLTVTEQLALRGALALVRGRYGFSDEEADAVTRWALTARLSADLVARVLAGELPVDVAPDGRILLGGEVVDMGAIVAGAWGAGAGEGERG